MYKTR